MAPLFLLLKKLNLIDLENDMISFFSRISVDIDDNERDIPTAHPLNYFSENASFNSLSSSKFVMVITKMID